MGNERGFLKAQGSEEAYAGLGLQQKKPSRDTTQPLASDPDNPRWRNSAQWARNTMRQEGLIKDDSPHGIWEISDAGRARLKETAER